MKEKDLVSFVSFEVQFRKVCAVYIYLSAYCDVVPFGRIRCRYSICQFDIVVLPYGSLPFAPVRHMRQFSINGNARMHACCNARMCTLVVMQAPAHIANLTIPNLTLWD